MYIFTSLRCPLRRCDDNAVAKFLHAKCHASQPEASCDAKHGTVSMTSHSVGGILYTYQ